jgi:hypothetical protein
MNNTYPLKRLGSCRGKKYPEGDFVTLKFFSGVLFLDRVVWASLWRRPGLPNEEKK